MTAVIARRIASSVPQNAPDASLFVNFAAQGGPPVYLRHFTGVEATSAAVGKNQALGGAAGGVVGVPTVNAAGYVTFPPGVAISTGVPFSDTQSWFGVCRCPNWTGVNGGLGGLMGYGGPTGGVATLEGNLTLQADLHLFRNDVTQSLDAAVPAVGQPGYPTNWFMFSARFNLIGTGGLWRIANLTAGTSSQLNATGTPSIGAQTIYIGNNPLQNLANYVSVDWKAVAIAPYFVAPGSADETAVISQLQAWTLNDLGVQV